MSASANVSTQLMPAVPAQLQSRIVSGMRWTLWLSILAAPFSYGTTVLLARAGPEVIGTFGLLSVYIGFVTSLLYLGGDAVVFHFVPKLAQDSKWSFLLSYSLIIALAAVPWLAAAMFRPGILHYVFGGKGGHAFDLIMLYLWPVGLG